MRVDIIMGDSGDRATYAASESEAAFDGAIQAGFGVGLGQASLVRDYGLTRRTGLFEAMGMALRISYTRYRVDIMGKRELTYAYRRVHPEFIPQEEIEDDDNSLKLFNVRSPEEEVEALLGLNKQYHPEELLRALTDPEYLGHSLTIKSWPEYLGFELFNRPLDQLKEVNNQGNYADVVTRGDTENRIRPFLQGRLVISPRFGDENASKVNTALVLESPLSQQIKATAFAGTYHPGRFGDITAITSSRKAVEEVNWYAVDVMQSGPRPLGSFPPDEAAANFVTFVAGLVLATKSF